MVTIYYFAWVKHKIGKSHDDIILQTNFTTINDVKQYLMSLSDNHYEALHNDDIIKVAINHEFADLHSPLPDNISEIAFFPPVTGG